MQALHLTTVKYISFVESEKKVLSHLFKWPDGVYLWADQFLLIHGEQRF